VREIEYVHKVELQQMLDTPIEAAYRSQSNWVLVTPDAPAELVSNTRPHETAFARGYMHARNGDYEKAIATYRDAIRIKPDYAEAHNNLGLVLAETGHLSDAIAAHSEAIRIKPGLAESYNNLGRALGGPG
jgi:tetratricopeptide (TPR) repeat protein